MQHLQPNTTLKGGQYRIERILGQGGFGNTYVGINTAFEEIIAIKEFFMQGVNDRDEATGSVSVSLELNREQFEDQREKFKKEARRLRKLKNEHIVNVHDLFEENGTAYYVMDYVDGENLAERLKRTGQPMTEQEVREILPQVLDALKSVHDAGIWHLDLKPANIMVDKSGHVKLIDFGASKQLNTQKGGATTSTAISYTNGYAPREQMEQNYDKFGPWTDLYALGATLYALLTNKRPPLPTDIDDDVSEDKSNSLPFPEKISEDIKRYVLWMMQTDRNQRPQSVSELQSTFEKAPAVPKTKDSKPTDDEETLVLQKQTDSSVFSNEKRNMRGSKENEKQHDTHKKRLHKIVLLFITLLMVICIMVFHATYNYSYWWVDEEVILTYAIGGYLLFALLYYSIFIKRTKNLSIKNKTFLNKWYQKSYCRYTLISVLVVCVGLLIVWNNNKNDNKNNKKEELKYKPLYKVLDSKDNTCELFASVPQTENGITISEKLFYGVKLNIACIPNSANGKYNIPQKVDDFKVVKLGDFSFCYTNLSSVNIPEGIKSIGEYAFARCEKLVRLIISNGVESIGSCCCANDYLLSEINLPTSLASIGNYAFESCKSLKSITLPNSLSVIGAGTFNNCSNLEEVFSNIQNPLNCELGQSCFDHIASDAKLYIPYGTKELYIKAGWTEHFSQIIER